MRTTTGTLGCVAGLVLAILASAATTRAEDAADMKAQLDAMKAQLEQMQQQLNEKQFGQLHREEMAKLMKEILDDAKAAPALPSWMENLSFKGDFRLRYQHDSTDGRIGPVGSAAAGNGAPRDANRYRLRLRFGFTKTWWNKELEVGFRLATGNNADSNSTNQTLDADFSKKPVWIDLMYAKYAPKCVDGLTAIAGKMTNPIRTATWMSWDDDINPEGFYTSYDIKALGDVVPYVEGGLWSLEDASNSKTTNSDTQVYSWIWNVGTGVNWKINKEMKYFFGVNYYGFPNFDAAGTGRAGGLDAQWRDAAGYRENRMGIIEMTTKFDWSLFHLPMEGHFSWVHNCQDTYSTVYNANADRHLEDANNAYLVGMSVGKNKKRGDWSFGYDYSYQEVNSLPMLAAGFGLADSDFGGPNRKGHVLKAVYNIDDFLTASAKMFLTDPVHTNVNSAPNGNNHNIDTSTTLQLDLVWKF